MRRIMVLGAGYAGLHAVKQLVAQNPDAEIMLINKDVYHYDTARLHEVAVGRTDPSEISFNLREKINPGVTLVIDEVVRIDHDIRAVELRKNGLIFYDYLINALGGASSTPDVPGATGNVLPLITLDDAMRARSHVEQVLTDYRLSQNPYDLRVAVCGDGFSAVAFMAALMHEIPALAKKFDVPAKKMEVHCFASNPRPLYRFDPKLTEWIMEDLGGSGVIFHGSSRVTRIEPGTVFIGNQTFHANTIVWATGIRGSRVVPVSGYVQKFNRVIVNDDLSVVEADGGWPREFVIGDVSAVANPETGRVYPASAQLAIQQADCAVSNVLSLLHGGRTFRFVFKPYGTILPLGPHSGVAQLENSKGKYTRLKGAKVRLLISRMNKYFREAIV
ncbi:FAD-dependent oxidoreductase [Bifidobacterium sp. ESL0798]|uniref:NAD(P)/FAD-dependent oxidoreductase n=1 Tax=Bifidobacterium sp. ESL0798 TaxID=2983235 RepID=UPI0023F99F86|nr:FAD-dependent oxidoreductase [Bifidobacterium sp. ESL0798]WEV74333.1 FAD-dependent oxidoreductase [Bifidobacterium sp. ESL0798]